MASDRFPSRTGRSKMQTRKLHYCLLALALTLVTTCYGLQEEKRRREAALEIAAHRNEIKITGPGSTNTSVHQIHRANLAVTRRESGRGTKSQRQVRNGGGVRCWGRAISLELPFRIASISRPRVLRATSNGA